MEAEQIFNEDKGKLNSLPKLLTREFYIIEYMLENEVDRYYCSFKDLEKGTPLYRQQIEDSIKTNLSDIVLRVRECPFCGKIYDNHIPPECIACEKIIFPELVGIKNMKKWYKYIYKLNEAYRPLLQEFMQELASHLLKIYVVS